MLMDLSQSAISFTILFVLLLATGCQTVDPSVAARADLAEITSKAQGTYKPPTGPTFFVELYPNENKSQRFTFPLDRPVTVQQALAASKARKRFFGKMKIEVIRMTNGRQVKLGVDYLPGKRSVATHTDYALHPGDRIVVTEEDPFKFDTVLDRVMTALE